MAKKDDTCKWQCLWWDSPSRLCSNAGWKACATENQRQCLWRDSLSRLCYNAGWKACATENQWQCLV